MVDTQLSFELCGYLNQVLSRLFDDDIFNVLLDAFRNP